MMTAVERARANLPGLALCLSLALVSATLADQDWVRETLRLSPLLLVVLLGMVVGTLWALPPSFGPGIATAQKPVLKWAVAGLGLKLSAPKLLEIGGPALVVVTVATLGSLAFGWWLALRMGAGHRLAVLLSVGTSVCGASAVVAADSVVQSKGEEAALALGTITLWGTVGIFVMPWIGHALGMSDFAYGVWAGATLQETAQVVAGAEGYSQGSIAVATVVKLARICWLAPIVFFLALWLGSLGVRTGAAKVQAVPWFLVAFVLLAAFNSVAPSFGFAEEWSGQANRAVQILLTVGMAGVGLKTDLKELARAGWLPVGIGLGQMLFLASLAYVLAQAIGV
jgi:uncharacterized integral membrane protein (TIGR00698 family)